MGEVRPTLLIAISLKDIGFMGRATSRDKSPICLLRSGRACAVEFDMDQTCQRPARSMSGRVRSGLVRVRVEEFGLYATFLAYPFRLRRQNV